MSIFSTHSHSCTRPA